MDHMISKKLKIATLILFSTLVAKSQENDFFTDFKKSNPNENFFEVFEAQKSNSNQSTPYTFEMDLENQKTYVQLNGHSSYFETNAFLNRLNEFTLMSWIVIHPNNNSTKSFLFGQEKCNISITELNKISINVNDLSYIYNETLPTNKWIHVSVSYGKNNIKLYINGEIVLSKNTETSSFRDISKFTIGKNPITNNQFFKGNFDEFRAFNKVLNEEQIQKMIYQEIEINGDAIMGSVIPKNLPNISASNLLCYYKFNYLKSTNVPNAIESNRNSGTSLKMYNIEALKIQSAPMPFQTVQEGDFATAIQNEAAFIRPEDIYQYDWSIINVNHNIIENTNTTFLGMLIKPTVIVSLNNNNKIQNNWYLKLDGKIDLNGKSQLVQTINSELDPSSNGFVERDQQGTTNLFNFNYWSSPVSSINNTTINHGSTIPNILKDGTNPENPQTIQWTPNVNTIATTPITLSSYWLFKFQNLSPIYANWSGVGTAGILKPGQGFTMKGSGVNTPFQNYIFKGKPNNGEISTIIASNNMNLSGNPYPSAIDMNAFIMQNSESTTGTLYFWEHFETNNTHNVSGYQGGYAARNLVGGTKPVSPAGISQTGTSSRIPGRYIPVGQGFMVYGSPVGGNIVFNNSQRIFVKETNSQSNILFRNEAFNSTLTGVNFDDETEDDDFMKIRIGFNSYNNFHRQVLLGFMNEFATSGIDVGYDAPHLDNQQNDMYFVNGLTDLTIQGEGFFNENNSYPIGIKTFQEGLIQFTLDGTENTPSTVGIFIHDNETNLFHDIRNGVFEINMPEGENKSRFSLRFNNQILANPNFNIGNTISVAYLQNASELQIKNSNALSIEKVILFNILGQNVQTWNVENPTQDNILLPVGKVSAGTYIVRIQTNSGTISKKIIIK